MTQLHLIVAHARNGVIGKENKLPWYLPEDLKNFKRTTLGKPVIMGRKTWESLGRPLPGRRNIVITRQKDYEAEGATVVSDLQAAIEAVADAPVAFIMGGAQVYKEALPQVEVAHITYLNADFEGDAYFEPLNPNEWTLTEEESFPATDAHPFSYSFRIYSRKH
ncbi:MAG TPA: dihydrofolate reductase [Candidatus Aphodousia faecigallinarum]|uniref:Dihydrofolate reductase n=1 Tax=Candidatus Aphodousia faecigallinarum TaxID=2840677 RepID=A0A9D1II24_9BURK|nr:dihydrofolate reductase [Candidatus Aphodousia faecigallinarum]